MADTKTKEINNPEEDEVGYDEHILSPHVASQMAQMYAIKYFEDYLPRILYGKLGGKIKNDDGHEAKHETYSQLLRATQAEHGRGYLNITLTLTIMINLRHMRVPFAGGWSRAADIDKIENPQQRDAVKRSLEHHFAKMDTTKDLVVLIEFVDAGCCFGFLMGDALLKDDVDIDVIRKNKIHTIHPDTVESPLPSPAEPE